MLWCALVKGGFIEGRARPNPPASQIRAVWWGLEASSQASERTPRLTIYKSFPEERAFSPLDPKWGLISPHVLGAERRRHAQHRCTPPPLCRCAPSLTWCFSTPHPAWGPATLGRVHFNGGCVRGSPLY